MRIHGMLRFAALLVVISGLMLVVSLKSSAATTPTPTLPRANVITLTPTLPPPRETPSTRITDPTRLPRAVTATTIPTSTPDPKASALDRAVSNSLAARSMRVNLDVDLTVTVGKDSATLNFKGDGFMINLDNPATLGGQFKLDATYTQGGVERKVQVELRIAAQTVYFRLNDPATNKTSPWLGITLSRLIKSVLPALEQFGDALLSGTLKLDTDLFLGFANTFGSHVNTVLTNPSGAIPHYKTTVGILGFLLSEDGVPRLIKVIAALAIPGMSSVDLTVGWSAIRQVIPQVIPSLTLELETEIDPAKELVSRVSPYFQITDKFNGVDVEINGTVGLSNYGVIYTVEVPTNAIIVESLDSKAIQDALQFK